MLSKRLTGLAVSSNKPQRCCKSSSRRSLYELFYNGHECSESISEDRTLSLTAAHDGNDDKYTSRSEQLLEPPQLPPQLPPRSFAWRLTGTSLTGFPEVLHRRRIVIESDKEGQFRRAPFCACSFLRGTTLHTIHSAWSSHGVAAVGYVAVTFGRG